MTDGHRLRDFALVGFDATSARMRFDNLSTSGGGYPSLDPVPQTLAAVIEARFVASVAALDDVAT